MNSKTIYHNPRCSKSRQTLAMLEDRGFEPVVIEYLKTPPSEDELRSLLQKLGKRPKDIIRRGEAIFGELGLGDLVGDDDTLIEAMIQHPVLIERPIVVVGSEARIGRPPEQVFEIL